MNRAHPHTRPLPWPSAAFISQEKDGARATYRSLSCNVPGDGACSDWPSRAAGSTHAGMLVACDELEAVRDPEIECYKEAEFLSGDQCVPPV